MIRGEQATILAVQYECVYIFTVRSNTVQILICVHVMFCPDQRLSPYVHMTRSK
jgi:hypothetical protein